MESIECGLLSIALYSFAADAALLPFYCTTGENFFKDHKKLGPLQHWLNGDRKKYRDGLLLLYSL